MSTDADDTKRHIEAGLAYEAVANRKYVYFAKLARELGDEEVALLFETIAQEESAHALAQLTVMYPPGSQTIVDLLRLACEIEGQESDRKYPEFASSARAERVSATTAGEIERLRQAERRFTALATKEAAHSERFAAMLKLRLAEQAHRPAKAAK